MTLKGEAKTKYQREYMRRRRAEQRAKAKPQPTPLREAAPQIDPEARIRELEDRNRKLEPELARERQRRGEGQPTRSRRDSGQTGAADFSEAGRLRGEIGKLKFDISKLKEMLAEEPDAAKLRKKVIDQQIEMAGLRRNIKLLVKERDGYQARIRGMQPKKYGEARRLLTRKNHGLIIKALHSDRSKHVTADELAEAERLAVALRPLFDEGPQG